MKTTFKDRTMICPRCQTRRCRKNEDGEFLICACCEREARNRKAARNGQYIEEHMDFLMESSGFPLRCKDADLASVALPIEHPEKSMFFLGKKGLGKTYTMAAIARQLMKENKQARYITVPEFALELRNSFTDSENTEHAVIEKYSKVPFLFLDDIGAEKSSEWVIQVLFILIDRRYMDGLHICVSSNLSLDDLSRREQDGRILSRLVEMCDIFEFKGEDRRIS